MKKKILVVRENCLPPEVPTNATVEVLGTAGAALVLLVTEPGFAESEPDPDI